MRCGYARLFPYVGLLFCAASFLTKVSTAQSATAQVQTADVPLVLTLQDALSRAGKNMPQFLSARTDLGLAHQDKVQARAALLPPAPLAPSCAVQLPAYRITHRPRADDHSPSEGASQPSALRPARLGFAWRAYWRSRWNPQSHTWCGFAPSACALARWQAGANEAGRKVADADGRRARRLTRGTEGIVSPDGPSVAGKREGRSPATPCVFRRLFYRIPTII